MTTQEFTTTIRRLTDGGQSGAALALLRSLLENSPLLDEAILQSARFQDIRKQIRLGEAKPAEAGAGQGEIQEGLPALLREIEEIATGASARPGSPALREEVEKAIAIVNSKNVVSGSDIAAEGDVHIGDKHITQQAEKIYNIGKIDKADFS